MKNVIYYFLLLVIVNSQPISENLAFRKVMENLKKSIIMAQFNPLCLY